MFFYESEYPWSNEKYLKRLDRFLILVTINNIDNLSEFYNFIKAIKSRNLTSIKDNTNKYIIMNLAILFDRTRDIPEDYSTFEKKLVKGFNEIKIKIESDVSNNSIIKQVGLKDRLSKDNLAQKIKDFSFLVKDKRTGGKINLIDSLMSKINRKGDWIEKLPEIKAIIDRIKIMLFEDPNSFKTFENIDRRFNSLIKTIGTTSYDYDEDALLNYSINKDKNIKRIIDSLKKVVNFIKKVWEKNRFNQKISK